MMFYLENKQESDFILVFDMDISRLTIWIYPILSDKKSRRVAGSCRSGKRSATRH
jgi:hypothetical protein